MYQALALGGGGVRGGLHVGALAAIERVRGNLQFPEGIYGCSVGSIVATAVAFGMSSAQIRTMFDTHFDLDRFIPPLRLTIVTELPDRKGLFSMDLLEQTLIKAFQSQSVDLTNKTLADAPQKLHIIASNMTRQTATIFQGNVRVLDAIKCSSCLPFVFMPQVLYNQVYLDGGIMVDSLSELTPPDTLVLHISAPAEGIYPHELTTLSLPSFVHRIYRNTRPRPMGKNVLWLQNTTIGILQQLSPEDKVLLYDQGYSQAFAFLSKRFPQKLK
jgi:predicted acylesterase/phospholipase RssA